MKMKIAICLVLIVALAGPGEARQVSLAQQGEQVLRSWSDMQRVIAGSEVLITARGVDGPRLFLSADESAILVLNLSIVRLSRKAERELRDLALTYGADLIRREHGEFVNGDISIAKDGLFVMNRKVADVSEVIQRIDRADVTELRLQPGTAGRGLSRNAKNAIISLTAIAGVLVFILVRGALRY
jgi:hypothetical protein